ncbi:hypothetical protein JCM6882_009373 [Rhodosporidiobolus microsporus]
MADVLVYGLAYFAATAYDKLATLRSPVIPISGEHPSLDNPPTSPSPGDALVVLPPSPLPLLTEYELRAAHYQWSTRHAAVWLRACALIDAKAKGYPACWAGDVSRENLRAVRAAVDEAKWVETKLKEAIDWCEQRKLGKMKLVKMVRVRKDRRSSITRPTHTSTPPSLFELPIPLPEAPPSNRVALSVPRPPPLEPEGHAEAEERNRPPVYTREADWENGESTLEGGYWEELGLPVELRGVVEEGLDVVQYERTRM